MEVFRSALPLILAFFTLCYSYSPLTRPITALDFKPMEYKLPFPPKLVGPLAPNSLLTSAQLLAKGNLTGPESVLVEGNTIYTTTLDGKVLRIVDGQISQTIRLNGGNSSQTCGTYDTEPICGRPLGIRRLNASHLVVADAYLGIFVLEFSNATFAPLFLGNQQLPVGGGGKCTFFNDLDVTRDGSAVYFSCSSTRWDRRRFMHDFLEGQPTGSLIKLNLTNGNSSVLVKDLNFANGVQLHPDQQSVLVNECSRARIVRYFFAGPKQGKSVMFADNLPGFPDNIRLSHDNKTFLVPMAAVRHSELITFIDKLGPFPNLRFGAVQFFPESSLANFFFVTLLKRQGFVLELDLDGRPVRTYQDSTGSVISSISEAHDDGDFLYLGSIATDFIAKVPKQK